MLQSEMIGKVSMDYRYYTGMDLYSDGAVEDELLDIVINHKSSEFGSIIEQKSSWPIFYHLSEQRGNIVEWIPMAKGARVLEVGSGCGAVTSALAKKEVSIDCVELSKKRSLINANRNREADDITIHVGNFRDIEPGLPRDYDYILLIGVLEYAQQYIGGEHPFETFIYMLMRHLAPGGRIVIAIENRLGMKYFAGCKEDHASRYFAGLEGYQRDDPARTFSRDALMRVIRSAGAQEFHFYYPYPDYKFTSMLHSDQYMPREGEFLDNVRNYDCDRMVLFNEKYAFETMARDRIYQDFANSFEVVIGPALPQVYVKYSNDRADEFKIRTDIVLDQLGRLQIRKHPLTVEARDHVRSMSGAYEALTDRYRGGDIAVNDCQLDGRDDSAIFSFVNGVTLASLMDGCVARGDMAGFNSLFQEYLRRISYREEYPVADYDLIFSNILVNGPVWTIIDYEWTYGKKIPTREIAFRALYSYMLEDKRRRVIDFSRYYAALGLDEAQTDALLKEEAGFQKYVTGGRKSMVEIWKLLGFKSEVPLELREEVKQGLDRIQIYTNTGRGFNETDSYFPEVKYGDDRQANLNIRFEQGTNSVRLDPAFGPCVITIKRIVWNEKIVSDDTVLSVHPNGAWLSDDSLVFNTDDPYIEFIPAPSEMKGKRGNVLSLTISTVMLPRDVADNLYNYQIDMPDEEEEAEETNPFAVTPPLAEQSGNAIFGAASGDSPAANIASQDAGVSATAAAVNVNNQGKEAPYAAGEGGAKGQTSFSVDIPGRAVGANTGTQRIPGEATAPLIQVQVSGGGKSSYTSDNAVVTQGGAGSASGRKNTMRVDEAAGARNNDFYQRKEHVVRPEHRPQADIAPISDEEIEIFDFGKDKIMAEPLTEKSAGKRYSSGAKSVYDYGRDSFYADDEDDRYDDDAYEDNYKSRKKPQRESSYEEEVYEDDLYEEDLSEEEYYEDDHYDDDIYEEDYDDDEGFDAFEDYDEEPVSGGFIKGPSGTRSAAQRRERSRGYDDRRDDSGFNRTGNRNSGENTAGGKRRR